MISQIRSYMVLALLASTMTACEVKKETRVYKLLSNGVTRLGNGDSVEVQEDGSITVNGTTGRMVVFYPFRSLQDVPRLQETANALFKHLEPDLRTNPPGFLVLRATDTPTSKRVGIYKMHQYGFVFELKDGKWYTDNGQTLVSGH